jgi:hypothetical protein
LIQRAEGFDIAGLEFRQALPDGLGSQDGLSFSPNRESSQTAIDGYRFAQPILRAIIPARLELRQLLGLKQPQLLHTLHSHSIWTVLLRSR